MSCVYFSHCFVRVFCIYPFGRIIGPQTTIKWRLVPLILERCRDGMWRTVPSTVCQTPQYLVNGVHSKLTASPALNPGLRFLDCLASLFVSPVFVDTCDKWSTNQTTYLISAKVIFTWIDPLPKSKSAFLQEHIVIKLYAQCTNKPRILNYSFYVLQEHINLDMYSTWSLNPATAEEDRRSINNPQEVQSEAEVSCPGNAPMDLVNNSGPNPWVL